MSIRSNLLASMFVLCFAALGFAQTSTLNQPGILVRTSESGVTQVHIAKEGTVITEAYVQALKDADYSEVQPGQQISLNVTNEAEAGGYDGVSAESSYIIFPRLPHHHHGYYQRHYYPPVVNYCGWYGSCWNPPFFNLGIWGGWGIWATVRW